MTDVTVAQLVSRTQRWLVGYHGQPLNRLDEAIDDTTEELRCSYNLGILSSNTYIGIGDEILYVWETNAGAKTAVVSRGQYGTEPVAHDEHAVVEAATRFPRSVIKDVLQEEVRSWPDTVFKVRNRILSLPARVGVVDAGVSDRRLCAALALDRSPKAVFSYADRWTPLAFRLDRQMPRDTFGSGAALTMYDRSPEAHEVRFLYGERFDPDDLDDDASVLDDGGWGLASTMIDIPPMGAAASLILGRELQRTDTEAMGESRIAAEVPPTFQTQTSLALRTRADRRINQEAMRLIQQYRRSS
jgi:hypothetical protein